MASFQAFSLPQTDQSKFLSEFRPSCVTGRTAAEWIEGRKAGNSDGNMHSKKQQ